MLPHLSQVIIDLHLLLGVPLQELVLEVGALLLAAVVTSGPKVNIVLLSEFVVTAIVAFKGRDSVHHLVAEGSFCKLLGELWLVGVGRCRRRRGHR